MCLSMMLLLVKPRSVFVDFIADVYDLRVFALSWPKSGAPYAIAMTL